MKHNKKIVGSIIIVLLSFTFLIVGYCISKPKKVEETDIFVNNTVDGEKEIITIYINGEVKSPGVYDLPIDSRVKDALKIAGGFTKNADTSTLNLAQILKDEEHIYIDKTEKEQTTSNIKTKDSKVNINKASKDELKTIPGVGDITADNIINYREEKGRFNSIDDIKKVDRIGEKTFEKIKSKIDIK
ncbi:helix-hairpin-helix domain-containing protein [Clostridium rectalis]|uniref:helix-hairpin-helix domain-containing protein n=1 Tax=Clostridium rectalis TaxID=2040295 RepID=UPI000F63379D|nr:helix-hairpin-helix domain-containing protein [Clostridium rectalis]